MRLKLTLAYNGTEYRGWQKQKREATVQQALQEAIARICNQEIPVHGSGRTDAGAHARGQVAHFDPPRRSKDIPWQKALNAVLDPSIQVVNCEQVSPEFHARFWAKSKRYTYTFWTEKMFVYPERKNHVWSVGTIDLVAMRAAFNYLRGKHDFSAFMNKGSEIQDPTRSILDIGFKRGFFPQEAVLSIKADGFLKQMVRNIAGALLMVGRNKLAPRDIASLLKSKDRAQSPATAPARGLCLEEVEY